MLIARVRWTQDPPRRDGALGPQDRTEVLVGPFARVGDVQRWRDEYVAASRRGRPDVDVQVEVAVVEDATRTLLQVNTDRGVPTSVTRLPDVPDRGWVQPW